MSLTLLIIGITGLISYNAFTNHNFLAQTIFYPYRIRESGEWYRFLSSGFIHSGWMHLIVNMYVLYMFGEMVEQWYIVKLGSLGHLLYLFMYLSAILASGWLSYIRHAGDPTYRSLGASGAVSAVVFSAILIVPGMSLSLLFIPIWLPAWLFGLLYIGYSIIMSKSGKGNINHDAHLLGAFYGFAITALIDPQLLINFLDKIQSAL